MKRVKTWNKFNESNQAAWGLGPFNGVEPTSIAGGSPIQPNDPKLTTDAFDRMKSNIVNSQMRLGQITQNIFKNTSTSQTVDLELEKLKILSIVKNESGGIDVLIEFKFKDFDKMPSYFGKFINWGMQNMYNSFKTNFSSASTVFNKKVEAILRKTLNKWFEPEIGEYRLNKDTVRIYDSSGIVYELKQGARVKVVNIQLENTKPMIHMKVGKNWRYLTDLEYWFFKWWFEKIPQKNTETQDAS